MTESPKKKRARRTPESPKISEALLDFAGPLLDLLPDRAGPHEMTPVLRIATLVWNAVVLETLGRESPYLEQARTLVMSNSSGLEGDFMVALLADMEERKRRESPSDLRLIGDFEFTTGESGEQHLRVNAHAASPSSRAT